MYSEVHTVLLWSASDCKTKSLVGETSVHHLNSFEEDEIMMKDILALTRGAIFVTTLTFLVIIFVNIWTNIWTNNSLKVESSLKCGCSRIVKNPKFFNTESTCDSFSSFRPNGQKIVSYSYFGKSDERTRTHYLDQIRYRAQEISVAYSDFVMRIYYHIEDEYSKEKLCDVWCENENVDLCDVENLPTLGDLRSFQPIGNVFLMVIEHFSSVKYALHDEKMLNNFHAKWRQFLMMTLGDLKFFRLFSRIAKICHNSFVVVLHV